MHPLLSRRIFLAGSSASIALFGRAIGARADETIEELRWALPALTDTLFVRAPGAPIAAPSWISGAEGLLTLTTIWR